MNIHSSADGGIGLLLYGMIACVGLRTVYEGKVDFSQSRNLVIASAILILSIGGAALAFPGNITIQGLAVGAIAGIILNLILPKKGE